MEVGRTPLPSSTTDLWTDMGRKGSHELSYLVLESWMISCMHRWCERHMPVLVSRSLTSDHKGRSLNIAARKLALNFVNAPEARHRAHVQSAQPSVGASAKPILAIQMIALSTHTPVHYQYCTCVFGSLFARSGWRARVVTRTVATTPQTCLPSAHYYSGEWRAPRR